MPPYLGWDSTGDDARTSNSRQNSNGSSNQLHQGQPSPQPSSSSRRAYDEYGHTNEYCRATEEYFRIPSPPTRRRPNGRRPYDENGILLEYGGAWPERPRINPRTGELYSETRARLGRERDARATDYRLDRPAAARPSWLDEDAPSDAEDPQTRRGRRGGVEQQQVRLEGQLERERERELERRAALLEERRRDSSWDRAREEAYQEACQQRRAHGVRSDK